MIKEWATVVSWREGVAEVLCEPRGGCGGCRSGSACGVGALSRSKNTAGRMLQVASRQPLLPGQRVELGITERSLLYSAALIYLVPLLGLFVGAAVLQALFASEAAAIAGAFLGGCVAFLSVRRSALKMGQDGRYQPVILQVVLAAGDVRVTDGP